MYKSITTGALLALALSGYAHAKDVTLRFAHWLPEKHPAHQTGFKPWANSISDASGGSIKFEFYPAQQLGQAKDHYDMARDGIADVTWINVGYQPGRFPVSTAGELPFLINNAKAGSRALDSWYRPYADKEMKDVKFCMMHLLNPGTLHSKAKISHPGQVKGLNVRPANSTTGRWVSEMGGASVQVAAPEAREALAKGTADAIFFPHDSMFIFGMDNVAKHHIDVPMYVTVFAIVMNKATYDGLDAKQKQAMDGHCTSEWAEKISIGWADAETNGRNKMAADPTHVLTVPTGEEMAAWRKAAEPLEKAWAADVRKVGHDPEKLLGDLKGLLKSHNSLFD